MCVCVFILEISLNGYCVVSVCVMCMNVYIYACLCFSQVHEYVLHGVSIHDMHACIHMWVHVCFTLPCMMCVCVRVYVYTWIHTYIKRSGQDMIVGVHI